MRKWINIGQKIKVIGIQLNGPAFIGMLQNKSLSVYINYYTVAKYSIQKLVSDIDKNALRYSNLTKFRLKFEDRRSLRKVEE